MSVTISAIVPVYNGQDYIEKCLDSILNQTFTDFDVIVVNDGSTDNTSKIISKYQKIDDRVKVISQANQGLSGARNTGISHSNGHFIVFIDGDDWIDKDMFKALLDKANGSELVACSYYREFSGMSLVRKFSIEGMLEKEDYLSLLVCPINQGKADPSELDIFGTVWGKLFHSSIIRDKSITFLPYGEIGSNEDLPFNLQYARHIKNAFIIDSPYLHYRRDNESSLTSGYKPLLSEQFPKLHNYVYNLLGNHTKLLELYDYRVAFNLIGLGLNELRNPKGFFSRYKAIDKILNNSHYSKSLRKAPINKMNLKWKVLFFSAKHKLTPIVYLLLRTISLILKFRNS
ncbi:glycosyltransferase family 2 protein [Thiomicrorhabdus sp. 6S2-11]|uniref:Glycosyltransferase family 2 protein n=1 Tax=Thiomicrorhabdus marina TaxID=2818442 RepID=A0ABS3Q1Y1_9GAMM|nr:glycosyltransferase family 2 protein [Thiomicrorhabdus marina]MBO1926317.1 glycosyltransferase family 2 protein [Thiomicrorhabdus marina]